MRPVGPTGRSVARLGPAVLLVSLTPLTGTNTKKDKCTWPARCFSFLCVCRLALTGGLDWWVADLNPLLFVEGKWRNPSISSPKWLIEASFCRASFTSTPAISTGATTRSAFASGLPQELNSRKRGEPPGEGLWGSWA